MNTTRYARLVIRNRTYDHFFGNLKEYDLELRGGRKGTGNLLWSAVNVNPNSAKSEDSANNSLREFLQANPDIQVVQEKEKE